MALLQPERTADQGEDHERGGQSLAQPAARLLQVARQGFHAGLEFAHAQAEFRRVLERDVELIPGSKCGAVGILQGAQIG